MTRASTEAGTDEQDAALVGGDDDLLVLQQEVGALPRISGETSSCS